MNIKNHIVFAAIIAAQLIHAQNLDTRILTLENELGRTKSRVELFPAVACDLGSDGCSRMLDITYLNGVYMMSGWSDFGDPTIYTSYDGIYFTPNQPKLNLGSASNEKNVPMPKNYCPPYNIVTFRDKLFATIDGNNGYRLGWSDDGIIWNVLTNVPAYSVRRYDDYLFTIGYDRSNKVSRVYFSVNAKDFIEMPTPTFVGTENPRDICYINGTVIITDPNLNVYTTTDFGKNWITLRYAPFERTDYYEMWFTHANNDKIVLCVGDFMARVIGKPRPAYLLISYNNGVSFVRVDTPFTNDYATFQRVEYHDGVWLICGEWNDRFIISTDLENWMSIPCAYKNIGIRLVRKIKNRLYIIREMTTLDREPSPQVHFIPITIDWGETSALATKKSLSDHLVDGSHVNFTEKFRWDAKPELPIDYSQITNAPVIVEKAYVDGKFRNFQRISVILTIFLLILFTGLFTWLLVTNLNARRI